jgi:predicted O-methyltransferase YrrM
LEKTRGQYWNISPDFGTFLNILIKTLNLKKVIEVGTSDGYSGIWMAEALSKTKGRLWTIESHTKERFSLAEINFKKAGLSNYITQWKGHAPEIIPKNPGVFDMVFLDATKTEYSLYFDSLKNHVKKNGLLVADNTVSHRKELLPFIKKISTDKKWRVTEFKFGSGFLVAVKI